MKKKNNIIIQQERPLNPEVKRILNQDDEDFIEEYDNDLFELNF